jgi:spore coat protein U-like protein
MKVASRMLTGALLLAAPCAFAQSTALGTANAKANILYAISISKIADLSFGDIVSDTSVQHVTIAPDGTRSGGGTGDILASSQSAIAAAKFTVSGSPGRAFGITLPADNTVTITSPGTSGMTPMNVDTFTSNPTGTGGTLSGSYDSAATAVTAGTATLTVGARLTVAASQVAGGYTGTFTVTVAYN